MLEGIISNIVVAVALILRGIGGVSITFQLVDYAIWFTVLGITEALNSMAIYFVNTLVIRMMGYGE